MKNYSKIPVVILCGGMGTRMRAVSEDLPKPMVDVGGKPILWHIMKTYSQYGVRKFILALGYKGDKIVDYFENYHSHNHDFTMTVKSHQVKEYHIDKTDNDSDVDDWEITFAFTGDNTMTGGRIKRCAKYIDNDEFFVTYGDGVSDVNIDEIYDFHQEHGKLATLTGVHLPTTFGIVESDEDGTITSFREKPNMDGVINGGYFVFNKEVINYIDNDATLLESVPFKRMVEDNEIKVFKHEGFWHCMDHFKDYSDLNAMWDKNKAPWKVW